MNSNSRNHRGGGPRSHAPNARQEWVPRGQPNAALNRPNAPPPSSNSLDQPNAPGRTLNQPSARPPSLNTPPSHGYDSTLDCGNSNGNAANMRHRGKPLNQHVSNGIDDRVPAHRANRGPRRYTTSHRRAKEKESCEFDERKEVKNLNLPQLVQEIQEKLTKGTVECMICYDMVHRTAPIWSCSSCYSIFHLTCIKKWARAPTSVDMSADKNNGNNWRCPGCQHVQLSSSKEIRYQCFCGKRTDPPSDLYLTPHSCGEPCGKPLERVVTGKDKEKEDYLCPHACVLQCHPGPCPPCKAFAPPRLCPCGKKTITTRCSDRKPVMTCGQRCDKLLECGRHRCVQICHVGPCYPCRDLFNASCFCKKKLEVVSCGEMAVKGEVDMNNGVFSCGSICGNMLGCENHACSEICHPGLCEECNLLPGKIDTCHCGKTNLLEERKSCLDPVPICSQVCGKSLLCRIHQCKEKCHVGDCPPCVIHVTQKCRCGLTSRTTECYKSREENFTCDKQCGRKKNCGRHRCNEKCCPLSNNITTLPNIDRDPHFCTMPCEKKLRCGQHYCQTLCHSGHCPPCLETIFSDLSCACGNTSLPPPLPCGTPPPSCQLPCSAPQPCGHPSSHSCHFGECPPCSVPVAKECVGGHVVLRNIPCGSKDIRCNKLCGKTRCCGLHACGRTCHPPPCDATNINISNPRSSCGQICGAPRRDCRHTCRSPCHPSSPCPDTKCDYLVTITCSCGRITASVPCDSGGANSNFASDSLFEASVIQKLPSQLQAVDSKVSLGQRKLVCDAECAKLDRKRVLADAFDIPTPNLEALHLGENPAISDLVTDLLRRDPKWAISVEERCKFLVLGKNRLNSTNLKVHVFCPMVKEKRDAVRLIADRWKLAVYTVGWEPRRFVVIHVTPKSKTPAKVLGVKGTGHNPPPFDPLVDMDPRLVVSFLELPREADISALVLRFGGECELVWLNDKNALAVFTDPARAATALRRLDHGSVYHGAVVVVQEGGSSNPSNPWGGGATGSRVNSNPWKKAVIQEASWNEEDLWSSSSVPSTDGASSRVEPPILASSNRWSVFNGGDSQSSGVDPGNAGFTGEAVDDWEKAYE